MKRLTGLMMMVSLLALLTAACDSRTEYQRLVDRELASGEKHNSLFLGISLGMRADSFYNHCFRLNKQELIKEGMGNTAVLYEPEELNQEVSMLFYPTFNKQTLEIREMPVMFSYKAWAPWNKAYSPDSLLPEVRQMFMDWYGGEEFLEVTHPEKGTVYVKVDGNRQIRLFVKDLQYVQAVITDLTQPEPEEAS